MSSSRKPKKVSNYNSILIVGGIIAAGAILLFVYLMWYVSPDQIDERVKVIANTNDGCIVETFDGYAINIGSCDAQPDQYIVAPIDQKLKERAALMNPTR
ncbi:MAG: hypothetical protein OEM18_08285 [Nitrosopumilus sp.]|nr:hypothetical protein [Nitrosopumilus sp.]